MVTGPTLASTPDGYRVKVRWEDPANPAAGTFYDVINPLGQHIRRPIPPPEVAGRPMALPEEPSRPFTSLEEAKHYAEHGPSYFPHLNFPHLKGML